MPEALPPEMLEHVAARFRVLGDATRLSIVAALLDAPEGRYVGELVDALGTSQANVSKHLRLLHEAGIVRRWRDGTSVHYAVDDPSLPALCSLVCDRLRAQVRADADAFAV